MQCFILALSFSSQKSVIKTKNRPFVGPKLY